jgi:hypothetical protein
MLRQALTRCFWGSLASTVMAAPQGPVCELRLLTIHRYTPGSTKGGAMPCAIEHLGCRLPPPLNAELLQKREPGVCRKTSSSALDSRPRTELR